MFALTWVFNSQGLGPNSAGEDRGKDSIENPCLFSAVAD